MSQVLKLKDGGARILEMRRGLLAISAVLCTGVLGAAQPLVDFLYDPRYHAAGQYLGILAFGTWLQTVSVSYGCLILAMGYPKYTSLAVTLRALIFFTLVMPVFHAFGVLGVAGLAALSELGVLAGCALGVRVEGMSTTLMADLALTTAVVLVALAFRTLGRAAIVATGRPLAGLLVIAVLEAAIVGAGVLVYLRRRAGAAC
jgi:O-antigen/teichoic acid export membrane protein